MAETETVMLGTVSDMGFIDANKIRREEIQLKEKEFQKFNEVRFKKGEKILACFNCWKREFAIGQQSENTNDYLTQKFTGQIHDYKIREKISGETVMTLTHKIVDFNCDRCLSKLSINAEVKELHKNYQKE